MGVKNEFIKPPKLRPWNSSTRAGCGGSGIDLKGLTVDLVGDTSTDVDAEGLFGVVGLEEPSTLDDDDDRSPAEATDPFETLLSLETMSFPAFEGPRARVPVCVRPSEADRTTASPPPVAASTATAAGAFCPPFCCNHPPKMLFPPEEIDDALDFVRPSPVKPIFDEVLAEVTACTSELKEEVIEAPITAVFFVGDGDGGGVDANPLMGVVGLIGVVGGVFRGTGVLLAVGALICFRFALFPCEDCEGESSGLECMSTARDAAGSC